MPSDSPFVFSINKLSGSVDWQTSLPGSFQLLDVSDSTHDYESDVLLGGDQLVWLNRNTGDVQARFPQYHANTLPGMRSGTDRGWGQPAMTYFGFQVDSVFFPVRDGIYQIYRMYPYLNAWRNTHSIRDPLPTQFEPPFKRTNEEFSGGGHLLIENGMIVIANAKEIRAVPLSDIEPTTE